VRFHDPVSMETHSGHQVLKLPRLKIIKDMAELESPKSVSNIRVLKAYMDDWQLVMGVDFLTRFDVRLIFRQRR
jgi:hypothetical protein